MFRKMIGICCLLSVLYINAQEEFAEFTGASVVDELLITRAIDRALADVDYTDVSEHDTAHRAQVDPTILSCIAEAIVEKYCPQP